MIRFAAVLPFFAAWLVAQAPTPTRPPTPPAPAPWPPQEPAPENATTTLLAFTGFAAPDPESIERRDDGMVPTTAGRLVFYVHFANVGELGLALTRTEGAPATTIVATCTPHLPRAAAPTAPTETTDPGATSTPTTTRSSTSTTPTTTPPTTTTTAEVPAQGETDTAPLGTVPITTTGFHRLTIATHDGSPLRCLHSIVLTGAPAWKAHAITRERRNAASVHLGYPIDPAHENDVEWFYCEVTPRTDPVHTFYMATGWSRGYFGMQVNSATERRLIFSVWDAGDEAVDRAKVAAENRVQLVAKGDGVVAEDFGNEGTGGHSHVVHDWRLGGTFQFLVHARPDGTHTTYTGWFRAAAADPWRLVASFRAPKGGKGLRGLHSFVENFHGSNGDLARDCEFGNVWARPRNGDWLPLRAAKFTLDPTGHQRLDRHAGVREDRFFLRTGGFELPPPGAVVQRNQSVAVPDSARTHPADASLPTPPGAAATK